MHDAAFLVIAMNALRLLSLILALAMLAYWLPSFVRVVTDHAGDRDDKVDRWLRVADNDQVDPLLRSVSAGAALASFRRAAQLDVRVGVKDRIKKLEKLLESKPDQAADAA